jgi:hypothetical protein
MLAFTMRVIITDIQRSFRGFWILFYFLLFGFITVEPFLDSNVTIFLANLIIILFSVLVPRITKIFYVLPLGSRLLRRYLYLRTILLSSYFIIVGSFMTLLSHRWHGINVEKGWLMIMLYVMISILINLTYMVDSTSKKDRKYITAIIIATALSITALINVVFIINFRIQLTIDIIFVILSAVLFIIGLRRVNLVNYKEPINYGLYTKAWREQRTRQRA